MAWTAPRTWSAGETLTAALLNVHLRDNLNAIREREAWFSAASGNIGVGAGTHRLYAFEDRTVTTCIAFVDTAPTGATAIFDVPKDSTTLYTTQANRPTISISGFASTETAPDVTAWAADSYLQADIDQVGSTIPGADATLVAIYTKD